MARTPEHRFHVIRRKDGFICATQGRDEAFRIAEREQTEHRIEGDPVLVYDSMAHRGAPHLWSWCMQPIETRSN